MTKLRHIAIAMFMLMVLVPMLSAAQPSRGQNSQYGEFQYAELNDRNATTKGATGFVVLGLLKRGDHPVGIIKVNAEQAFNLTPGHDYYVFEIVQPAGEFDENLLGGVYRYTATADAEGRIVGGGTFPGPAGALDPGDYRVDIVVTDTEATLPPSTSEGDLIMQRIERMAGAATEPLLTSEPFYRGIEITVPAE